MAVPKRSQATESTDTGAQQDKPREQKSGGGRMLRKLGLGLVTGAADDDPSAIGTYASAGAAMGPAFLWTAPVTFPMKALVFSGIVQGFSTPPLLLLIMLMTNNRKIMGHDVVLVTFRAPGWDRTSL